VRAVRGERGNSTGESSTRRIVSGRVLRRYRRETEERDGDGGRQDTVGGR